MSRRALELRRIAGENRAHRVRGRGPVERALARDHLVEHRAEAEDVGAVIDREPAHLLRRHVAHGAEHHARRRARSGAAGHRPIAGLRCLQDPGKPEVQDLRAALAREEDVVRLQIAVDDVPLVGRGQAARDLRAVLDRLAGRQGAAFERRPERFALEQLRDDVVDTALRSDVVDGQDVRMVQGSRRAGLLLEALQAIGVGRRRSWQHLDRHVAIEPRVAAAVDLAHPARPEERHDLVAAEPSAGSQWHARRDYTSGLLS